MKYPTKEGMYTTSLSPHLSHLRRVAENFLVCRRCGGFISFNINVLESGQCNDCACFMLFIFPLLLWYSGYIDVV